MEIQSITIVMAMAMVALIIKMCHSLLDITPPFIFLVDLEKEYVYLMLAPPLPFTTRSPSPLIIIIHSTQIHILYTRLMLPTRLLL